MKTTNINSILVIDDCEADLDYAEEIIERSDVTEKVFKAIDGQDALEFLSNFDANKSKFEDQFAPKIILLDINMPRVDGFAFLEKFSELKKTREDYNSLVIAMYTSSDNQADIDRALSYDFVKDYVIKPISNEDLAKIESLSI